MSSTVPDAEVEVKQFLAAGIRDYFCGNHTESVDNLDKACQMIVEKYGESSHECVDPYFHYGLALLALSRSEEGQLPTICPPENQPEEEEEQDEFEEDEQGEQQEEEGEAEKGPDTEIDSSKDIDKSETDADVSYLQLSWEVFGVCLNILLNDKIMAEKDRLSRLSQVYLNLAQISLESGNFDEALGDISKALEIRKNPESCCSVREVAECYYHTGLVYVESKEFESAIENFRHSIEALKSALECPENAEDEISKLVEELEFKITECEEGKNDIRDSSKIVAGLLEKMQTTGFDKSANEKCFNDITHLLHRKNTKRSYDGTDKECMESAAKKLCENSENLNPELCESSENLNPEPCNDNNGVISTDNVSSDANHNVESMISSNGGSNKSDSSSKKVNGDEENNYGQEGGVCQDSNGQGSS